MQRKSLRTSTEPPAVPPAEDAAKPLVGFKSPMLLLPTTALPEGPAWQYELKLDGYRALAFTRGETVHLRSRNDKDFTRRYADIVKALTGLPDNTLIDGELVSLDAEGRPSFNALQNGGSTVVYYVFDLLVLAGRDVTREPLDTRRALLETQVLPRLADPIKYIPPFDVPLAVLVQSVKAQGLEGVVAKRRDSVYEAGVRSGAWMKMRVNRGQDFVIAGYTRGTTTFDALILGYFERPPDLRRENAQWLHASHPRATLQAVQRAPHRRMPVRQSARGEDWPLGARVDESQDGRVPMAHASSGRALRVLGVDWGEPPSPFHVHRDERR